MSAGRGPIARVRAICLALPEAVEKPFGDHTAPAFRVRDKFFVMLAEDGSDHVAQGAQGRAGNPRHLRSRPLLRPQVRRATSAGWGCGSTCGTPPDWDEMTEMIMESYCLTAPKRLAAQVLRGGRLIAQLAGCNEVSAVSMDSL